MKQTLQSFKALLLVLMVSLFAGNAWAETKTIEINTTNSGVTSSYATSTFTVSDVTFGFTNWMKSTTPNIQAKKSTTNSVYNTTAIPGNITKITVVQTGTARAITMYGGTAEKPTTQITSPTTALTMEFDFSGKNYTYFSMTTPSNAVYMDKITIEYEAGASTSASAPTLTAAGTFTTPTYDVTITNNESGATVYYTTDGNDPTTSSDNFTGDSKTLTISATTTVKAMAVVSGKDNSSIASATYTYEKSIANTAETAYTTAEAIALIDAGSSQLTSTQVYVKGTVSKVDSYNSTYGSITYWLDDNAFEVYSGLNNNGDKFTSVDDVQVGAEVVVYGIVKKYGTTYEFDKNNWLVQYTAPAKSAQTVTLGTYKTAMTTADAADSFTAETNGDGALSVESSDPEVATATISEGTVTVTPVAAGTTTITVTAAATDTWNAGSKSYTLTVSAPVLPAALPFSFDGNGTAASTTQGVTNNGVGNYSSAPKLKFDTTGDNLIINYNADAGKLSYTIKGNSMSGTYQFDVMESADGTEYTSVKSYTEFGSSAQEETATLNAASRYVKFVYTTKSSGNVALGAISIKAAGALEDPELAFEKTTYTFAANAEGKAVQATSAAGSTGAVTYALTEGDTEKFLIDENTGDIVCETAGTYTVTATIAATEEYESKTATATVTIEEATATPVVLVAKYGDKYYAMDCDFDAVQVRVDNGKVYVPSAQKENLTWNMTTVGTETTFTAFDGEYLAPSGKSGLQLQETSFAWTLDSETKTWSTTVSSTVRSFFYQAASNAFKNYATQNAGQEGYSDLALAYTDIEGVDDVTANMTINKDAGCATFCAPFDLDLTNYAEVYNVKAYTADEVVDNSWISMTEVTGTIPAGTAVVLYGDEIEDTPHGFAVTTAETCTTGVLTGNIGSAKTAVATGNYLLQTHSNVTGWYKVAGTGLYIGVNRCYMSFTPTTPGQGEAKPYYLMGFDGMAPTAINNVAAEAKTKKDGKYLVNGQLVVVKAGKAYNAAGIEIK